LAYLTNNIFLRPYFQERKGYGRILVSVSEPHILPSGDPDMSKVLNAAERPSPPLHSLS